MRARRLAASGQAIYPECLPMATDHLSVINEAVR